MDVEDLREYDEHPLDFLVYLIPVENTVKYAADHEKHSSKILEGEVYKNDQQQTILELIKSDLSRKNLDYEFSE